MALPTLWRRFVLTLHVLASVGWIGAVAAFIVLDVATVVSDDAPTVRAAYVGMDLVADFAIVPLALAALATGVVVALGTHWGLFRHYWVVVSLVLTVAATLVLLAQTPTIDHRAAAAADPAVPDAEVLRHGNLLLHSVGGTVVLVVIAVLNIYKPKGLTPYGWRRQQGRGRAPPE